MEKNNKVFLPTTIVVFGATGDLVRKKIISSLLRLYCHGYLPEKFRIIGVSRRDYSHDVFRKFLKENAINTADYKSNGRQIKDFLSSIYYYKGNFNDKTLYQQLKGIIEDNDTAGICNNKLFYLAVPPKFYSQIFTNLAESGLAMSCSPETGWTRVLVEKPFGSDIATARELDSMLGKLFREEQIFRIDHYLAKYTIQNILFFRFSNMIFDPAWNNRYISKVEIKLLEDIDIGTRGAFYDSIGALRDVGQNHMLQMLALIAMDNPEAKSSEEIRKKRLDVLNSLLILEDPLKINSIAIRGQYDGYRETQDISGDSETETYFKIKVYLDSDKWSGVPFYLESGKALAKKRTEIIIYFHNPDRCLCSQKHKEHYHSNILKFEIYPHEGISLRFWGKKYGLSDVLEPKDLKFDYQTEDLGKTNEYDRVLLDCMNGDQTLFVSTGEERQAWNYITPIIENWDRSGLHIYKKGSNGPLSNI